MPLYFAASRRDSTALKENDFGSLSHRNHWIIFSYCLWEQPLLYWECWQHSCRSCCGTCALILRAVQCCCFWGHSQCPSMNAVVLSNDLSSTKKYFPFYFCSKAGFPVCYYLIWRRWVTSTNHFVTSVKKIIAGNGLILLPVAEFDFFGCCTV